MVRQQLPVILIIGSCSHLLTLFCHTFTVMLKLWWFSMFQTIYKPCILSLSKANHLCSKTDSRQPLVSVPSITHAYRFDITNNIAWECNSSRANSWISDVGVSLLHHHGGVFKTVPVNNGITNPVTLYERQNKDDWMLIRMDWWTQAWLKTYDWKMVGSDIK